MKAYHSISNSAHLSIHKQAILKRYWTLSILPILFLVLDGCDSSNTINSATHSENQLPDTNNASMNTEQDGEDHLSKTDSVNTPLASSDLAIVIAKDRAQIQALEVIPRVWLDQVDEALLNSELEARVSDESWPEDWKLVSLRIAPCSPIGRIADAEEIDRLCWPGIRLVFQPIIEHVESFGVIQDHYADDRAIHALYRFAPQNLELNEMLSAIKGGARLNTLSTEKLIRFETARDEAADELIQAVLQVRVSAVSDEITERAEFYQAETEEIFWKRLSEQLLTPYCPPEALHELTAFSLPLGRRPESADLWSFVAFHGHAGEITQVPIEILDPDQGTVLFRFEGEGFGGLSEDVTSTHGDIEIERALNEFEAEKSARLAQQVISDTDQLITHGARINDPRQTLVSHTSCASCHRANDLNFNFHNLSYFADHSITVSPRTLADVKRDLEWSEGLRNRRAQ